MITQSELLVVMTRFVEKHCTKLKVEERDRLAKNAVLAQTEYKVLHCLGSSPTSNYENGIPAEGTWILPDVLGRRDVVLEW